MSQRDREIVIEFRGIMNSMKDIATADDDTEYEDLDRQTKFDLEMSACRQVFIQKNKIYGDAFEATGVLGTVAVLVTDAYRIREMVLKAKSHGRGEPELQDKLMDIVNQAVICLMMLHEENFEGI